MTDRLGKQLRRFRTEDGAELLDVADGQLPDPDTPVPARFLPEYDNSILGYADRSRVIADAANFEVLQGGPGGHVGSLLVDGFVSALWALRRNGDQSSLQNKPAVPIPATYAEAIHAEATQLARFLVPGRETVIQLDHD